MPLLFLGFLSVSPGSLTGRERALWKFSLEVFDLQIEAVCLLINIGTSSAAGDLFAVTHHDAARVSAREVLEMQIIIFSYVWGRAKCVFLMVGKILLVPFFLFRAIMLRLM